MKRIFYGLFYFALIFSFISCDLLNGNSVVYDNAKKTIDGINQAENIDRLWTLMIYMSADNNLEANGLEDLSEMEKSNLDTDKVTVLILMDRNSSYDASNDNWSGTRLYKLKTGKSSEQSEIISDEIECKALGISVGGDTELDMSSEYVLGDFIAYSVEKFPAENFGLVIWGHGTGWRDFSCEKLTDETMLTAENISGYKGFAYDETSGTYMSLYQLGNGIKDGMKGELLDFVGFDTCFGCELEVLYELKDYVKFGLGSEGLISASGWNYKNLFDYFNGSDDFSVVSLCSSVINQFAKQYSSLARASICGINFEAVEEFENCFNDFSSLAAKRITDAEIHDEVMSVLYSAGDCKTEKYTYGISGYDVYLDVISAAENLNDYFGDEELTQKFKQLDSAKKSLIINSWASDRTEGGIGLYFSTLTSGGILSVTHPAAYINGKTINQIDFVRECTGYVPQNKTVAGEESLLDKLFYTDFSISAEISES